MRASFRAAFALAAAIGFAAPAKAGVIIDTFGPGNTFEGTSGGYSVGPNDLSALRFTLGSNAIVDDVAVAAQAVNFLLYIVGDDGGLPGATVLGTVSSGFTIDGYIEFDPAIALTAGDYWLVMAGASDASGDGWYFNDSFLEGGPCRQSDSNGADWEFGGPVVSLPAVRIGVSDATQVPIAEPGTLTLAAAGLLGMAATRRRNARRA